jgi:cytochrome c-type biogenesis protein CcmH
VTRTVVALFAACLIASAGHAGEAPPAVADPALEARVLRISEELRCLVCQNQTIADSNAGLAVDLRNQVREMLQKGMEDRQVVDFMVQRYGDFVLYRPPVKGTTWLLWFGPFVLFVVGLAVLIAKLRKRNRIAAAALSNEERAVAARLLNGKRGPKT